MGKKKDATENDDTGTALAPGHARLKAPDGCTVFSHDGNEYEVGPDGIIDVPNHVASELHKHGFTGVE